MGQSGHFRWLIRLIQPDIFLQTYAHPSGQQPQWGDIPVVSPETGNVSYPT